MTARTLMVLGTSSSAGKSLMVTALCHSFARRGLRVAPFKAQNMSNNAAVCPDGAEIGRAQALQARAAGLEPRAEMNPILIKPEADTHSQVVVMGRPYRRLGAAAYYSFKEAMWGFVTAALDRLRAEFELVIMEGAGSPVELNLKANDIVNMAAAQYAGAPALLVGDIDRGGIFAQLLGTLWLLEPDERKMVRGFVVNKFRGDLNLFQDGVRLLEEKGGVPVLGVIPFLHDLGLPEEDAVALDSQAFVARAPGAHIDIAVIHLPLIANFDDFDPFRADPGVHVRFVTSTDMLGNPDAICLPGTKSTSADLEWLRRQGFDRAIQEHAQRGGAVVGICGGYQMLGQAIQDPQGVESMVEYTQGLGLLPTHTIFAADKVTRPARAIVRSGPGWLSNIAGLELSGYEIHMGRTETPSPWLELWPETAAQSKGKVDFQAGLPDGAATQDGRIWGCYLHGIFTSSAFRTAWLRSLGWQGYNEMAHTLEPERFTQALDRLTNAVEAALDMKKLEEIIWGS
jgi:adenosylcobyric acid synthase